MSGSCIVRKLARSLTTLAFFASVGVVALKSRIGGPNIADGEEFKPIKEAEMPKGFPACTPVGQVEVKQYPAYRRATTSGLAEFWVLFAHIKQNNVTMTAPVEMDYGDWNAQSAKQRSMSFLYERPDQGTAGKHGGVEVVDVPAMTVLSIGCRGPQSAAAIADARGKLLEWLDRKKNEYVASGALRVMGYNSPFVPRDKNFFEVQIPIKPLQVLSAPVQKND